MDFKKILFKTNEIDVERALPDAVFFCNKDGKIQWVNDKAALFFETSKMHLLTSNIADFIENAKNVIMSAINTKSKVITKLLLKEVYFEMTASEVEEGFVLAFRNADGSSLGTIKEECVKKDDKSKNEFLLKLTNDFKSPLQSIVGFSQAMSDGLGGAMTEQQDKYIKIINKNSSELMYFITKLMELTQTEIEDKSPEYKIFDIISTINTVVKFNEQLYKEKDLKWNVLIEDGVKKTVTSDEAMIKTIIQNILEVVVKAVDMGEIVISLSVPTEESISSKNLFGENFLQISVFSNALLLSESDLECMFDPYSIVDTSNRKNVLRAMTLACVKNLVKTLNGAVWVESKILKNTSFNIIIPQGIN